MIYLQDNPLLKEPLKPEHIKNRLLGHWGSSPGLAFIYIHLNRLIKKFDLDMIFMAGPGHGAPGVLGRPILEGTYSEIYPEKSEDERGLHEFFKQFSFPGGIGSHCTPETPGSIHEGGELGYVLSHACGAAFDNPELIVAAVVGDGESRNWSAGDLLAHQQVPEPHSRRRRSADPAPERLQDQQSDSSRAHQPPRVGGPVQGYGWTPYFVEGSDPESMHQAMAATVEHCIQEIRRAPAGMPANRHGNPASLAHDRAAITERMGRAGRSGWPPARGILARPPGSIDRCEEEPRTAARFSRNGCAT